MTDAAPIAVVTDHNATIEAFRARKEVLNLSDAALEARANLATGSISKILAAVPSKQMGVLSLWAIAWGLGMKVAFIEDADAMALHAKNADERRRPDYNAKRLAQLSERTIKRLVSPIARAIGKRGGDARTTKMTPAARSRVARMGGLARWKQRRIRRRMRARTPAE